MSSRDTPTDRADADQTTLSLANSTVVLEEGPAGTLARIERDGNTTDYAGPLPAATIRVLRRVAQ